MKGRPSPFFKTASRLPSILAPAPSRWVARLPLLVFHFTIAAAAVYYLASRVLLVMVGHVGPCRLLYGELVFLFIFAVMRVSALGPAHFSVATYVTGPIGHTFLVGPSMVLPVRRFCRSENGHEWEPLRIRCPRWSGVARRRCSATGSLATFELTDGLT